MKTVALDIGDAWTGIAISDALGLFARPLITVSTKSLISELTKILSEEQITTIVVGFPRTLQGTESEQTKKTKTYAKELEQKFPTLPFCFWDERLTSKQAARIKKAKNKKDKLEQHAIAAALILQSYLDHQQIIKSTAH